MMTTKTQDPMLPITNQDNYLWGNFLKKGTEPYGMPHLRVLLPTGGRLTLSQKQAIRENHNVGETEGIWVFVVKANDTTAIAILDNSPLAGWVELRDVVELENLHSNQKPYITRKII